MLEKSSSEIFKHGSIKQLAEKFKVSEKIISIIVHRGRETCSLLFSWRVFQAKRKNNGRKENDQNEIKNTEESVPINTRGTIRRLSSATEIYKSTLHDLKTEGIITRYGSFIERSLKDNNKIEKIKFAISFLHSIKTRGYPASLNNTENVLIQ